MYATHRNRSASTTGAIYGQLAGAFYGAEGIPERWIDLLAHRQIHGWDESRLWTIGQSRLNRLLVVVHTERGDTIRIIGARPATAREQRDYEEDPT